MHHKSNKCLRLRETFKSTENENDKETQMKIENANKKMKSIKNINAYTN